MEDKIKTIEVSLLNEIKIDVSTGEFDKIAKAKIELTELFETQKNLEEFLDKFIPVAYENLISKNEKKYTHIGFFFETEDNKLIEGSFEKSIITAMNEYGDGISGPLEAAKMVLNFE